MKDNLYETALLQDAYFKFCDIYPIENGFTQYTGIDLRDLFTTHTYLQLTDIARRRIDYILNPNAAVLIKAYFASQEAS